MKTGRRKLNIRGNDKLCFQESDYPTEESKKEFTRESFKIDENRILNQDENRILNQDENRILNQDEKLKQETVKLVVDKFSGLPENPKHYGETDVLEFIINNMR